ncbi:MAG: hypothetical protein AB1Z98_28605 [Nannocystaceae bacterium]
MLVARLAALAVLVGGCSSDPEPDASTDAQASSSSSDGPSSTTEGETNPATTSGPDEGTGSGTSSPTGETGPDPDGSGSSSGGEPIGSPGCMAAPGLAEGEHQLMLDGYDRRYIVRLPANYSPDQPWPLIFALHGNGGNPGYWDATGGDRDIRTAFATEAVIIIPEAIGNAWRDYDAPPETWPERIELELSFFDTVYETARQQLCIDDDNVFSMGFSGGGSFSGVLGCRRDYIRAIAVGGSVVYFEAEDCVSTPAAWVTIGEGELSSGREAFRDFFRDRAGCQEGSSPGEPAGCVDYDGCDAGTPVTYCSHPAGHVWPSIGTDATRAFFQSFYAAG